MYTLSGNANILSSLNAAEELMLLGLLEASEHKRNGKLLGNYDLYDIFIKGNLIFDERIQSGDVILVNSPSNLVGISGGVARPAIYEFSDDDNLESILSFTGGFLPTANTDKILVKRNFGPEKSLLILILIKIRHLKFYQEIV